MAYIRVLRPLRTTDRKYNSAHESHTHPHTHTCEFQFRFDIIIEIVGIQSDLAFRLVA